MPARLYRSSFQRPTGVPLQLYKATTTSVTTTCTNLNTWYSLNIGTLIMWHYSSTTSYTLHTADFVATTVSGSNHRFDARFPEGLLRRPCMLHLYSGKLGTSHTSPQSFKLALFDVSVTPNEMLAVVSLPDCPVTDTADSLTWVAQFSCSRTAQLRFFVMATSNPAGTNFKHDTTHISFKCLG